MSEEVYQLPAVEPTALESTDDLLALAERRIEKIQKMTILSLKVTNHQDWVDQNGKPYLMGSGAEKVARLWGIKIHDVQSRKINSSDDKGNFYFYEYTGIVELPGGRDSIHAVGTCSCKDQFFAATTVESVDEEGKVTRVKALKPLSEVDETNIMKSAYTNFLVNGITRLLGIRNLTYDQLKEAGIATDRIGKVEYRNSEMSEGGKTKKDECWQKLLAIAGGDEKGAKAKLQEMTAFTGKDGNQVPGKNDINRLSEKQIEILHGKLAKVSTPSSASALDPNLKLDMIVALKECTTLDQVEATWKTFIPKVNAAPQLDKIELQKAYMERKDALGKVAK